MFMKKLLVIGMIVLFNLTSCSIDWNNEKDTKISELEKQITEIKKEKPEENLFKKKQECLKLTNSLIERTQEIWIEFASLWKYSFEQVFYSPIKDNCLWVRISTNEYKNWWYSTRKSLYEVWNDSWSSKSIYWCSDYFNPWEKRNNDCDKLEEEIKKLKWE